MDRHYYYRQLGLTCDASTSQVKKAYEERMAKLNSADYADDPEYRRKKKEEATSAYKALIGSAPLSFGGQGSTPFEKIKAALDREDDFDDCDTCVDVEDKPSFKGRFERNKSRSSGRERKEKRERTKSVKTKTKGASVFALIITIITIAGSIFGIIGDIFEDTDNTEFYNQQQSIAISIDYYDNLDSAKKENYKSKINYYDGKDKFGTSDTYYETRDVMDALDVDDADDFFEHITGDQYFYQDYDDLTCAKELIAWIGAPDFKKVAGMKNEYNGDRILSHADYLNYIEECLWNEM